MKKESPAKDVAKKNKHPEEVKPDTSITLIKLTTIFLKIY